MTGMRVLVLGLFVASTVGVFQIVGCDKPGQEPQPKPTPPSAETKTVDTKEAPVLEEPLPPDLIQIKAEITRAKAQLDMTVAKLEVLLASGEDDIDKASEEALAAIKALDTETQELKKRADAMRERGAAYFEAWETQLAGMKTASIKKIAEASRDELSAKYGELLTAMQEARAAFDPLWADLQTIQTAVDDGVTAESVKELAPQVKKVKDGSSLLKGRIDAVNAKVGDVAAIYTKK